MYFGGRSKSTPVGRSAKMSANSFLAFGKSANDAFFFFNFVSIVGVTVNEEFEKKREVRLERSVGGRVMVVCHVLVVYTSFVERKLVYP